MTHPYSLELLIAKPILDTVDFRRKNNRDSPRPSISCRLNEWFWDAATKCDAWPEGKEGESLAERVLQDAFDLILEDIKNFRDEYKDTIISSEDGYHLLLDIPLYELWTERSQLEEDLADEYKPEWVFDRERVDELVDEIDNIEKSIVSYVRTIEAFHKFGEGIKHTFDNFTLIKKSEEVTREETEWRFEHKDFAEDLCDSEGFTIAQ